MGALDERKQKILKAVVQEHVDTAEPVGSELLAAHYDFGVRSATIRNEMAELSELGYLRQPHTSAGRVPSDLGYRFYVDRLMEPAATSNGSADSARTQLASIASELDQIIAETCRLLAQITSYTSIATQPITNDTIVTHIGLSGIGGRKLLLVLVLSDGHVEHRILDAGDHIPAAHIERMANYVAVAFVGKSLESAATAPTPLEQGPHPFADHVLAEARQIAQSLIGDDDDIYIEGTNYILKHPEFKDVSRLGNILAALEERRRLYMLLSRAMLGPDVTIIIGSENPYAEMRDTSFVASTYRIGHRTMGTIGVVGPTRMDYRRAISAVNAMARNLSELLTLLSMS